MIAPNRNDRGGPGGSLRPPNRDGCAQAKRSGHRACPRPAGDCAWPQRSRDQSWRTSIPAARRSAASACGICRKPAGSSGRQNRHAATSQALTTRSSGPQRRPYSDRTDAGSSEIDGHSVHAYDAGGRPASGGSTGPSGGFRTCHASSRATGEALDGPVGREHRGDVRLERREVGGQPVGRDPERPPDRQRLGVVALAGVARQRLDPGVVGDDRRVDERGVDPEREVRVAGARSRRRGSIGGARSGAGSPPVPRSSSRRRSSGSSAASPGAAPTDRPGSRCARRRRRRPPGWASCSSSARGPAPSSSIASRLRRQASLSGPYRPRASGEVFVALSALRSAARPPTTTPGTCRRRRAA